MSDKEKTYRLTITADGFESTDKRFTVENLALGDGYLGIDAYFEDKNSEVTKRKREPRENKHSNQILPRVAFQVFEKQIEQLSESDKKEFPICRYTPKSDTIRGIYDSIEEFEKDYRDRVKSVYRKEDGSLFVIYSWNVFSTIIFAQECLKRFGDAGDKFILEYEEKENEETIQPDSGVNLSGYNVPYSDKLIQSKNIIFRGAPGTGKTFLAKAVAADIISNGELCEYESLTDEQKQQVEFVQFHPNYDYSDFVEGIRPKINEDGSMEYELKDGIFKRFIDKAKDNYDNSQKEKEVLKKELNNEEKMDEFFSEIEFGENKFKTSNGSVFSIASIDDDVIGISVPTNEKSDKVRMKINELRMILAADDEIKKVGDIRSFFGNKYRRQVDSYLFVLSNEIRKKSPKKTTSQDDSESSVKLKKYIFIIDEINRGEISKILGELFYSIDPGYRGEKGKVSTQYSNMHIGLEEKMYIPENVFIIGTMNDIDRSVDSFDFAMRRRFRFIEIKPEDNIDMLEDLSSEEKRNEAVQRMNSLNDEIKKVDGLNENYQIGPAYFLNLKKLTFDELWTDCLQPLLKEYIQGIYDEETIMRKFEKAYGYESTDEGMLDETD